MNVYFLSKLSNTDHVSHDGGSVIREENRAKKGGGEIREGQANLLCGRSQATTHSRNRTDILQGLFFEAHISSLWDSQSLMVLGTSQKQKAKIMF